MHFPQNVPRHAFRISDARIVSFGSLYLSFVECVALEVQELRLDSCWNHRRISFKYAVLLIISSWHTMEADKMDRVSSALAVYGVYLFNKTDSMSRHSVSMVLCLFCLNFYFGQYNNLQIIYGFVSRLPINVDRRSTMEEQSREEQCLRRAEEYVKEHDIQRIVKDCIVQLCLHRPDNPYSFLRQHFASLEKVLVDRCIFIETQPPVA